MATLRRGVLTFEAVLQKRCCRGKRGNAQD
jgi:hypothetical protein